MLMLINPGPGVGAGCVLRFAFADCDWQSLVILMSGIYK